MPHQPREPRLGPYAPQADRPNVYAMVGDEPLMFKARRRLSAVEREHLEFMRYDIPCYVMGALPASKADDHFFLDDHFLSARDFFDWHLRAYRRAGLRPTTHLHFVDHREIHSSALKRSPRNACLITVCFSHQLGEAVDQHGFLKVSKAVNSKINFATHLEHAAISAPRTFVAARELVIATIRKNRQVFAQGYVIKTDGLGGGFNVFIGKRPAECATFLAKYPPVAQFVIQERFVPVEKDEYIVDFVVGNDRVALTNTRLKLVQDGQWYGNIYSPHFRFSIDQVTNLYRTALFLQTSGYRSRYGMVCGFDYFQDGRSNYITDINARWTAGFPTWMTLRRLDLQRDNVVVSTIIDVDRDQLRAYRRLVEQHLCVPSRSYPPGSFGIFPLSFGPLAEPDRFRLWPLVIGDFFAFAAAVGEDPAAHAFLSPLIASVTEILERKRELVHGHRCPGQRPRPR